MKDECSQFTTLTIGNFDGIHLGHQTILQRVIKEAQRNNYSTVVITFKNHPLEVLEKPAVTIPLLCSRLHKINLLEKIGFDQTVELPFVSNLADQTPEQFLDSLREKFSMKQLILGYDAKFGKNRSGDRERILAYAKRTGLQVEYLPPKKTDNEVISSSRIRSLINKGALEEASKLLGRPYSIQSKVIYGEGKGRMIGYPTANVEVDGLCLPPFGTYSVKALINGQWLPGIAHLGLSPTIKNSDSPSLEVHFFELTHNLYGQKIEVIFKQHLRNEKKFDSIQALQQQIEKDIHIVSKE